MYALVLSLILSSLSQAKPLRVGLLDTGVDLNNAYLRPFLAPQKLNQQDEDGHGTHLAGILTLNLSSQSIQLYNYKFSAGQNHGKENLVNKNYQDQKQYLAALSLALTHRLDFLNISLVHDNFIEEERQLLQELLKQGAVVVVSAGNDNQNLDQKASYPCSYRLKGLHCIGASNRGHKTQYSNYGQAVSSFIETNEEIGFSLNLQDYLTTASGTSQSAAKYTRQLINQALR